MWTIAEDMVTEAQSLGVTVSILDPQASEKLHRDMKRKYSRSNDGWPLWDGPSDYPAIQDEESWRLIAEFVGKDACIVLWDPHTEQTALRFETGVDLVRIVAECHRTEFYVTDDAASFMLCFNHHDFLIAAGRARDWLGNYRRV